MKISFSLLLALTSIAPALAQTSGGNIYDSNRGGFLPGFRSDDQQVDFRARNQETALRDAEANGTPCSPTYGPSLRPCVNGREVAPTVRRDIQCTVTFSGLDVQNYTSGGRTMKRLIISGRHNAPEGGVASHNFSVADGDGFLTLAAIHAHWQTARSGVIRINSGYPAAAVAVPAAELRLAREAAEMGLAYYRRIIEIISAEPRPANFNQMSSAANEKIRVLTDIAREVARWETLPGGVPARAISRFISEPLERFASGIGADAMMSQYRDGAYGDRPQLFCNREAESAMVGTVLCNSNFVDGQIRDTAFCGGGITLGEGVAALRMGTWAPPGAAAPAAGQR